jgi:hypothetical protein
MLATMRRTVMRSPLVGGPPMEIVTDGHTERKRSSMVAHAYFRRPAWPRRTRSAQPTSQRRHKSDFPVGPDERFERLFSLLQKLCEPRVSSKPPRVRTPSRWRSAIDRRGSNAPSVPRNLRIRDACHAWVRLHSQASWGPPGAAARQPRTAVAVKGRDANTARLF